MDTVFLEGDSVSLLPVDHDVEEDVDLVQELLNSSTVSKFDSTLPTEPVNRTKSRKWLKKAPGSDTILTKVRHGDAYAGIAVITDIDREVDVANVGTSLLPGHHGDGVGTEAVALLTEFCFDQLRLRKVTYMTTSGNQPAIRLVEKLGAELEGVLREEEIVDGELEDVHRYGIMADEWDA